MFGSVYKFVLYDVNVALKSHTGENFMLQQIKSNQLLKLLREEKDIIAEQVVTYQHQVESQNLVVRKLEEKERILLNNLAAIEKELQYVHFGAVLFIRLTPVFVSYPELC